MIVRAAVLAIAAAGSARAGEPPVPEPASPSAIAAARDPFEAELARIDLAAAGVHDLRADFEQRRLTPLLREPIVSSGRIVVKGPRTKWETRKPRELVMVTDGREIRIHDPEPRTVEIYTAPGDVRDLTASPLPRLEALRRRFSITKADAGELGLSGHEGLLCAELRPTDTSLQEHIETVRIAIDPSVPCLVRMEITDPDGERTEITFSKVRINTGVDDEELELRPPSGTREVRPLEAGASEAEPGR